MSFLDSVVNVARSALGIETAAREQAPKAESTTPPRRGRQLASDTATTFEPASNAPQVDLRQIPSLADRFGAQAQPGPISRDTSKSTMASGLPPHLIGTRDIAPPTESLPPHETQRPVEAAAATPQTNMPMTAQAVVSDAATKTVLGTAATLEPSGAAGVAAHNIQRGLDYYARTFGRNGLDGAGSGVDVLINDRSTDAEGKERLVGNGGYFATTTSDGHVSEAIHFGTRKYEETARGPVDQYELQYAEDLAIHELTHGVIRKETGHLGGEADEAGATNEAIADVMAASATRDWSIGESMYSKGSAYGRMRNIAEPDDPTAIHGLWTSMSQVETNRAAGKEVEEHWASGIISTVAYRVQQRFEDNGNGHAGWSAVERIFYDAVTANRLGDMSFSAVADALRTSATSLYGAGSAEAQAFDQELRVAGL